MKNPWMSPWLSAANRVAGTARGKAAAEMRKAQGKMLADWRKAATGGKAKRKKKGG